MSNSETEDYKEKDIVWAKIKGNIWWPSIITQVIMKQIPCQGKTTKQKIYTIELIGEKTTSKIPSEKIESFTKNIDKHSSTKNISLIKSIEIAKKLNEKKTKKDKEKDKQINPIANIKKIDEQNKIGDNKDYTNKFIQKKRNNDRVILDEEQNEEDKDDNVNNINKDINSASNNKNNNVNDIDTKNVLSTPNNNIKINININVTTNNQSTLNFNSFQSPDVIAPNSSINNINNNNSNSKPNIKSTFPHFKSINYSTLSANEKTGNKSNNKKEKNNNIKEGLQLGDEESIKSIKKELIREEKKSGNKKEDKNENKNMEYSLEENENGESDEENEELILTNDIIKEIYQKLVNYQVQISNISSQKNIIKELTNLSEKFSELIIKNQNTNDNSELYYLTKDLIPILLNFTYNKNSDIMSKSSEILAFLNEKIIMEIFNLSEKDQTDLIESFNIDEYLPREDQNKDKDKIISLEERDFKEGEKIVELINKKGNFKSGFSDAHTNNSKRGRPKKVSTNSELSSEIFSSKLNDYNFSLNNNNLNEKNYNEEFIKIISCSDKIKMESEFKELCGDFFDNIYDKNNNDLEPDLAKIRKKLCIKIFKISKKLNHDISEELLKKIIVYFEYKIRNDNCVNDKIYLNKIKELFETIKEKFNNKNK